LKYFILSFIASLLGFFFSFLFADIFPKIAEFYFWPAEIVNLALNSEWRDQVTELSKALRGGFYLLETLAVVLFWWLIFYILIRVFLALFKMVKEFKV